MPYVETTKATDHRVAKRAMRHVPAGLSGENAALVSQEIADEIVKQGAGKEVDKPTKLSPVKK